MHDGMPYGRNQGQGQGHSREVDRQSPTGLIFIAVHTGLEVIFGVFDVQLFFVQLKNSRNICEIFHV